MTKIEDSSYALGKPSGGRLALNKGEWTDGPVATRHGFVVVYAQGDANSFHVSRLDFIWDGRLYIRSYQSQRLSPRGLVTAAARFAEEIAGSLTK